MKRLLRLLACLALACSAMTAHAREFSQAELDAILAPIALYPDPLLAHVLNAAVYPDDVASAAAWSRDNPRVQGDAAMSAVEGYIWHPSVKVLVAYPDILARMAESPQWVSDLGEAYLSQSADVTSTVQSLRARAQETGNLQSNDQQYVYNQGDAIYVQPVYPNVVYAPYYDPFVVYGGWWWAGWPPFAFRPWYPRVVVVTHVHPAPVVRWSTPVRPVQRPPIQVSPHQGNRPAPIHNAPPTTSKPWRASSEPSRMNPSAPVRNFTPAAYQQRPPVPQPQVPSRFQSSRPPLAQAPRPQPAPTSMPAAAPRATPPMQHWVSRPQPSGGAAFAGGHAGVRSGGGGGGMRGGGGGGMRGGGGGRRG